MDFGLRGDDILLLSIIFFVSVVGACVYYMWKFKRVSLLDPCVVFLFFFCLFVLPLPCRAYFTKVIEGDVTEHLPELLPYMPFAIVLCAVGIPFFLLGYFSRQAARVGNRLPVPRVGNHPVRAFVLLSAFAMFLILQLARDSDGLLDFFLSGYGIGGKWVGKGYLAIGFPWLFVGSLFLLYRYAISYRKRQLLAFCLVFGAILAIHALMGRRGDIAYMLMAVTFFWHCGVRPLNLKRVLILGIGFFFALNLFGVLRGSNYESLGDFWSKTATGYSDTGYFTSRWFYTLTMGEFVVPFETLPQMVRSVGTELSPEFGWTYLRAPVSLVPSVLYPNRPPALSTWYMDAFYGQDPNTYVGRQFFFLSESYLNFGPFGIPILMYFWGLLAGIVWRYQAGSLGNPAVALIYALIISFFFLAIAGDFSTLFVGLASQFLCPAVIGLRLCSGRGRPFFISRQRGERPCRAIGLPQIDQGSAI